MCVVVAQWAKAFVHKPDDLSSIPRSHMVNRENTPERSALISATCPSTVLKGGGHHFSSFSCKDPQSH